MLLVMICRSGDWRRQSWLILSTPGSRGRQRCRARGRAADGERWNDHGHAASCDGSPAMTMTILRYQAKPERAEENQQLIEAVFAELDKGELDGFTYKVFRLEDDMSFIHVWIEHDTADPDSLQAVPAFQAFMADLADRCAVSPVTTEATVVGGYR
jgi:hypothetical protein